MLAVRETAASASGGSHPSHAYSQASKRLAVSAIPVSVHARGKAKSLLVVKDSPTRWIPCSVLVKAFVVLGGFC